MNSPLRPFGPDGSVASQVDQPRRLSRRRVKNRELETIQLGTPVPYIIGDAIWHGIRETAYETSEREPLLERSMQKLVLRRQTLADGVAAILAERLASAVLPQIGLHRLIHGLFEAEPVIVSHIVADLTAVKTRDPACLNHLHVLLNMKGFHALQTYRAANLLWRQARPELALALSNRASLVFGVDIHPAARIGCGVLLDHGTGIVIGETAVVEDNVSMLQNVTLGGTGKERGDRHPKIRAGVMIGAGANILGNIDVGAMSKVAAGSVVLDPVPPHCTVAGVPARLVRRNASGHLPAFEMDQTVKADE